MRLIVQLGLASAAMALLFAACTATDERTFNNGNSGGGGSGSTSGSTSSNSTSGVGVGGSFTTSGGTGGMVAGPSCKVIESQGDAVPDCTESAPANAFSPEVQWTWSAPMGQGSLVTPLVANFTDDNADGAIDLCDIPDVVVTIIEQFQSGTMYLLSGDKGTELFAFKAPIDPNITPALGDIDGDGLVEVVTADASGHVVAFEHDGSLKWTGDVGGWTQTISSYCHAFALYDLEGDGNVEIIGAFEVFDSMGKRKFGIPGNATEFPTEKYWCPTPTAADLDGDGKLEVLFGHQTYKSDGTLYWSVPGSPGHPHVANLDADPEPEVYLATDEGISVIEHNGVKKFGPVRPTDPNISARCWGKPGVIHDFDGDSKADMATGSCSDYSVYLMTNTATPKWSAPVVDQSGLATGTAFDFLGDGIADAIYADENKIYVFDGNDGKLELESPRTSGTLIEYPVVVDVDNDGSAEIIVVSNFLAGGSGAMVTVLKDAQDRWIQARRIWNQHSYHVTNVREDGVIPKTMKKNWQLLNTFRTNSQIGVYGDCDPIIPN